MKRVILTILTLLLATGCSVSNNIGNSLLEENISVNVYYYNLKDELKDGKNRWLVTYYVQFDSVDNISLENIEISLDSISNNDVIDNSLSKNDRYTKDIMQDKVSFDNHIPYKVKYFVVETEFEKPIIISESSNIKIKYYNDTIVIKPNVLIKL